MKIRKTYREISPELLFDEIKDFVQKQGAAIDEAKLDTYSLPSDSSSFISRGTLIFKTAGRGSNEKECLRVHIVGSARSETKVMYDIDEALFSPEKVTGLLEDIDFIFGTYEIKQP